MILTVAKAQLSELPFNTHYLLKPVAWGPAKRRKTPCYNVLITHASIMGNMRKFMSYNFY